jgi:hypothetical protein
MIKPIVFLVLLSNESPKAMEGSLFNEYDYEYVIEARRRGKGNKKRRRGGNGLR